MARFLIKLNSIFLAVTLETIKNKARYIAAKNASDVWVITAAPRKTPKNMYDLSRPVLEVYQITPIRKNWDTNEGQCPHVNPVYRPPEKTKNEIGSDIMAAFLLNCLITRYISKEPKPADKNTIK